MRAVRDCYVLASSSMNLYLHPFTQKTARLMVFESNEESTAYRTMNSFARENDILPGSHIQIFEKMIVRSKTLTRIVYQMTSVGRLCSYHL